MLASLVSDYEKYNKPGVTFVSINTSMTATVNSVKKQIDTFKLKPFATMLDSGGITATAYNVPKNAKFFLVVIDGGGKVHSGENYLTAVDNSLKKYTSVLYDISPPKDMERAAHLFDLQQFALMDAELIRVLQTSQSSTNAAFSTTLRQKVVEVRQERAKQIQTMAATNPVQAYREAVSFVGAFPQCTEISALRTMVAKLKSDPKINAELKAEDAYQFLLVPEMRKTTNLTTFDKKLKPLADSYLLAFGNTDFGKSVVAAAVDMHREAIVKATTH